ncbi:hypothetical protein HanIR_Chr06g0280151 [Helianthus annuus]|nr:hypothetical protein HanIR_Chr06g0280151 [Helianthus annuus]
MLEAADETNDQASLEEEEHENHGETKNAELEQKLFSGDAVLKSLCDYSHKDHTKTQTDKKQLDWSFQKAIKGWMDDKVDWPAKLTDINTDFRIPNSNAQDSFWAAPKFGPQKTQVLAYRWVHEGGQPTIEWLIAWCANYLLFDLRASRLSGQDVLIQTRFLYGWEIGSDLLMG